MLPAASGDPTPSHPLLYKRSRASPSHSPLLSSARIHRARTLATPLPELSIHLPRVEMSRFAVLADLVLPDGGGDLAYGRGGGGVARGRHGDGILFYLRILFSGQVSPTGGGDGGQGGVDVEAAGGDGVVKKRTRKTYVPRVYDVGVRVPIVAPYHLNEEVVPFPPFRIRNRRDAKKAAADAKSGSYGNATISHGSYGEGGNLQFY